MRPWVKALNSTVDTIKKLAGFGGVSIGGKEMAARMGMKEEEFMACLSGESRIPQKLMSELWPAYEYLLQEQPGGTWTCPMRKNCDTGRGLRTDAIAPNVDVFAMPIYSGFKLMFVYL